MKRKIAFFLKALILLSVMPIAFPLFAMIKGEPIKEAFLRAIGADIFVIIFFLVGLLICYLFVQIESKYE